jgi:3',5'-cyclic AMP phosphodiesterase CpdA
VSEIVVVHISDIHFGGRADLPQVAALEQLIPTLRPRVIVISGDHSQRARHGEFQAALRYIEGLARTAPVHLIPGNHDAQWWRSPLGVFGEEIKFEKYRRYFGQDLTPVLELDDVIVAGMLSAHGLSLASLTLNPNDTTVKGNLPRKEVERVKRIFAATPPHKARLAVLHHNVLPGVVSHRWGLARPHVAQRRLLQLDADLVLCGHDHTEGAGQIAGRLVVSTAGTHSTRNRHGRPSAFNLIRILPDRIGIEHYVYQPAERLFRRGDTTMFARQRSAAQPVG